MTEYEHAGRLVKFNSPYGRPSECDYYLVVDRWQRGTGRSGLREDLIGRFRQADFAWEDLILVEAENGTTHLVHASEVWVPKPKASAVAPYEWKPRAGYSLVLRTSERRGDGVVVSRFKNFGKDPFIWPETPGSVVEAADFTTDPSCGHGFHGLEWGHGMRSHLAAETDSDAVFQVLDVADGDIIRISLGSTFGNIQKDRTYIYKVKFRRGTLVYSGDFDGAAKLIADNTPRNDEAEQAVADLSGYRHKLYAVGPSIEVRDDYDRGLEPGRVETINASGADLISSELAESPGIHTVALDIDYRARLVPSGTKGKFHLYLDRKMVWKDYKELLLALAKAGVIEQGYADASIRRGATFLRTPHRPKKTL